MHQKPFTSNALWPDGACGFMSNETQDRHETYEQAKAVCDGLERLGWGGEGMIFPTRTWVSYDKEEIV